MWYGIVNLYLFVDQVSALPAKLSLEENRELFHVFTAHTKREVCRTFLSANAVHFYR